MMLKIPHGGRCLTCSKLLENCSSLDFDSMQGISKPDKDNIIMVRCTEHTKKGD